ncbi:efflux RND transporter permease subunit [Candidatus Kirkpatrickella diaphorinae]|uniref:Efflux RND transporter permease subunit n=1 Tax=Candidatus Kirkpatrickella diaphorinae TaxID=2984322 RepID=A0ABY6GJP3_9PROT|nr:efflux RND transporter permease subunit [Candidatus Kirkpatrickella diaphorinae]UYH51494.1 efflux RND transporter permease subunit [Candidatus Kirkpatrickella diaphorinae]
MNISRPFILRPVATILMSLALLVAGAIAYRLLPVADAPNIDLPVILVIAQQPGGSPSEVAATVAAPLERHLGAISGVTEMTSTSTSGQTRIILQFDLSRDIDGAARDVSAAIQAARRDLPTTMRDNPTYFKSNPNGSPALILALTSDSRAPAQLYDIATKTLQQQLSQVEGVGEVEIGGSAMPAVRVEINPLSLYKFGIGFEDVRAALASANAHTPKGFLDVGDRRYMLDTNDQARKAADYDDLVIAYRNNSPLRLNSVATIKDDKENLYTYGSFDGKRAVVGIVYAQAGANIVKMVDGLKARLPFIKSALPADVDVHMMADSSRIIRSSLADTRLTLFIAVILVIGIVLVFLHSVAAVMIPAIVVPVSIIGSFAALYLFGYQLDNLSLMALTISTGFIVDDAIVVLENITRHLERGLTPMRAALIGAREVVFTVVSMTSSLIAVFIPIILLDDLVGRFFREFAMTISISLVISMVLSLTLTPMICALLLRPATGRERPRSVALTPQNGFARIERVYARMLDFSLRHQWWMILTLPGTLILAGVLLINMPKGFFPEQDLGMILGRVMGDESASYDYMLEKTMRVEEGLKDFPEIDHYIAFFGGRQANQTSFFVSLSEKSKRKRSAGQLVAALDHHFADLPGAEVYFLSMGGVRTGARRGNGAYQYSLLSPDAEALAVWTPRLVKALSTLPEIADPNSDLQQGGASVDIAIKRDLAARYGLTAQLISNTLFDAYGQRAASVIYTSSNQYRVIMEADPRFARSPGSLLQSWVSTTGGTPAGGIASNNIRVRSAEASSAPLNPAEAAYQNQMANSLAGGANTSSGAAVTTQAATMVPLTMTSDIVPTINPLAVNHEAQAVSSTISFNLRPGHSLGQAIAAIKAATVKIHLPPEIRVDFAGNAALFQKTIQKEPYLILAALVAVYVVLGILYESLVHPITILSTLPSAGAGAIIALRLAGEEFSLMAMIGVILLIGIVKKNAIILIDFAIREDRAGLSPVDSIRRASLARFRPIIMTSLAAAFGAIPLIITGGYGEELRRPLGISILGGLIFSQALTLFTVPAVFLILDRLGRASGRFVRATCLSLQRLIHGPES